jgi:hypothetical protein
VAAADIMTSVDIIVGTLYFAQPPRRDLTMPHGHGVDNCSLRFYKKGRQLDLGESRSLTQIFQWNQLLASHRLWVYVYAFAADCDDGDGDDGDGDDGDGDDGDGDDGDGDDCDGDDGDGDDGDGDDGDGDDGDGDDGDDDGVGDGDHSTGCT